MFFSIENIKSTICKHQDLLFFQTKVNHPISLDSIKVCVVWFLQAFHLYTLMLPLIPTRCASIQVNPYFMNISYMWFFEFSNLWDSWNVQYKSLCCMVPTSIPSLYIDATVDPHKVCPSSLNNSVILVTVPSFI
jgi:hypothetical protein